MPLIHEIDYGTPTSNATEQVTLTVDGQEVTVPAGTSIMHAAMDAGVAVSGYLTWSLMDNFEWAEEFSQRFGLVRVDFDTLERTPKDSYFWFRDLIAAQNAG